MTNVFSILLGGNMFPPFLSQVMNKLETRPEKTMCKELIAYEKGEYSWSLANANFTTVIFNNAILILWKFFTKV